MENRYQGGQNHVSEAETAMAEYLGVPFALGLNSGGSAIFLALKLAGVSQYWWKAVKPESRSFNDFSNQFLVPGDSGHPCPDQLLHPHPCPWSNYPCWRSTSFRWVPKFVLLLLFCSVECSAESFQIDLESLKEQQASTGARHLLLCYMRGKLPDMEGILHFCRCWSLSLRVNVNVECWWRWESAKFRWHNYREQNITLIEDCAHVLGSKWRGKALGTLGLLGCYSTQTNKLINRLKKETQ